MREGRSWPAFDRVAQPLVLSQVLGENTVTFLIRSDLIAGAPAQFASDSSFVELGVNSVGVVITSGRTWMTSQCTKLWPHLC